MTLEPPPGFEFHGPRPLGRLPEFDDRSLNYPIRTMIGAALPPRSYTWAVNTVLDQGNVGSCVGNAIAHEIAARPVVRNVDQAFALDIYHRAQRIDPWPGENYEGTSVLAGIKTAAADGHYAEYRWAFGIDDLILALGYKGPAVLGVTWFSDMFTPDMAQVIRPTGSPAGGHAILANGISIKWPIGLAKEARSITTIDRSRSMVRLHNSWGRSWGLAGECFIAVDDLGKLLAMGGEACIPIKRLAA